jgi:hypothetical protein
MSKAFVIWRRIGMQALLAGSVAGIAVGGAMMRIAWQHNSQGEIHEAGRIYWGYWVLIGLSWALPVAVVVGALVLVVLRATRDHLPS